MTQQSLINSDNPLTQGGTNAAKIPALRNRQVQEVFRLMVEEYGLGHLVLLETAGRNLVTLTRRLLKGHLNGKNVTVLAGAGNCGAAGLASARYLANAGVHLNVILSRPVSHLGPLASHEHRLLTRFGITSQPQPNLAALKLDSILRQSELVIDTLIGGSLHGWPTGTEGFLIQILRQANRPTLSLDVPSGLPPDGQLSPTPNLVIRADATLALGLPRLAHVQPQSYENIGELYLGDMGIPPQLYAKLNLQVNPLFSAGDLLLLRQKPQPVAS